METQKKHMPLVELKTYMDHQTLKIQALHLSRIH